MKTQIKLKNKKSFMVIKAFIIFIFPIVLTMIFSISRPKTYEFVDEENKRMVAPAAPFTYLPPLFSDLFSQLRINWCSFCIQNNSSSKKHSLPFNIGVRLEGMENYLTIHYGETNCFPIFKEDIFYDVAVGGLGELVIPNKEWVEKHFELVGNQYRLSFEIKEVMNWKVYSKLSLGAMVTIYIIFVSAMFAFVKLFLSIHKFLTGKR